MAEDIILSQTSTTPVFRKVESDSITTFIHFFTQKTDNFLVKERKRILIKKNYILENKIKHL